MEELAHVNPAGEVVVHDITQPRGSIAHEEDGSVLSRCSHLSHVPVTRIEVEDNNPVGLFAQAIEALGETEGERRDDVSTMEPPCQTQDGLVRVDTKEGLAAMRAAVIADPSLGRNPPADPRF